MTHEERMKKIDEYFDNLSAEEFEDALIRAGIENYSNETKGKINRLMIIIKNLFNMEKLLDRFNIKYK